MLVVNTYLQHQIGVGTAKNMAFIAIYNQFYEVQEIINKKTRNI
jgi:hypothetical protein